MPSRRGFLSTLVAAVAAPFLPKLPPIKIKKIAEPLPYWPNPVPNYMWYHDGMRMEIWPKPTFDYAANLERANRHMQKMMMDMAEQDLKFLSGDTWEPRLIFHSSASPSPAPDSPSRQS